MDSPSLLILTPTSASEPQPPAERPLGRAALALEREGVPVLLGDRCEGGITTGWRAQGSRWVAATTSNLLAVHDRYPSESRRPHWDHLRKELGDQLLGNPPALTLLCKDKLESQRWLEDKGFEMPPVEGNVPQFKERLKEWRMAFLKPRFGSQGKGILLLGDSVPQGLEADAWVLQRAVNPPREIAGLALRILVQREPDGRWWLGPLVARQSHEDPVVNVSRGAEVVHSDAAISADCATMVQALTRRVAAAMAQHDGGERLVELGLDFVVDEEGRPQLIEVNSCPRGRLLHLATIDPERWAGIHQAASERPLRRLLQLAAEDKLSSASCRA